MLEKKQKTNNKWNTALNSYKKNEVTSTYFELRADWTLNEI